MDMGDPDGGAGDSPPSGGGGGALQDSNNNHACIAKQLKLVTPLALCRFTNDQGVDTFGLPKGVSPSSQNNADDTRKALWGKKYYSISSP